MIPYSGPCRGGVWLPANSLRVVRSGSVIGHVAGVESGRLVRARTRIVRRARGRAGRNGCRVFPKCETRVQRELVIGCSLFSWVTIYLCYYAFWEVGWSRLSRIINVKSLCALVRFLIIQGSVVFRYLWDLPLSMSWRYTNK